MQKRVSGIIIKDSKILLIKRYKKEKGQYYVLPGGKLEDGESEIEGLERELKEETNLNFEVGEKLYEFVGGEDNRVRAAFYIENPTGTPKMVGPELEKADENNQYELMWVNLTELHKLNIKPDQHMALLAMVLHGKW